MLDRMLEIGSIFDWISPLFAFLKDMTNGPSHTFLIPDDTGWSGIAIERLLRDHGIKTWGLMLAGRTILITVRAAQAAQAEQLLQQKGLPLLNRFNRKGSKATTTKADARNKTGRRSRPAGGGLVKMINQGIDDLLGFLD